MKYYLANLINISSYKKMICTDIDGTLTLHDGNIGEFTIETIKNLTKNGYLVVLCTARSRESAIAISKKVGASPYVICSNGAEIYDYKNNRAIYSNTTKLNLYTKLWDYCCQNKMSMSLSINDKEYVNEKFWPEQIKIKNLNKLLQEDAKVKQCMIVSNNYKTISNLFNKKEQFIPLKSACRKIEHESCGFWFNLLDNNCSKGNAILFLRDHLNLHDIEIISFGNDYNDISMFQNSTKAYAVANCDEEIINYVDDLTLASHEEGVALFLKDSILYSSKKEKI